jgi:hypothetical protein
LETGEEKGQVFRVNIQLGTPDLLFSCFQKLLISSVPCKDLLISFVSCNTRRT